MERIEQNVQDVMVLGWTEEEARAMDCEERRTLAATSRRLQKQVSPDQRRTELAAQSREWLANAAAV